MRNEPTLQTPILSCVSLATGQTVPVPRETVLCLGNFDGVHRGHRALIAEAAALRNRCFPTAVCGVFCFRELSADVLLPDPPAHLTTPEERMELFAEAGAEVVLLADFASIRSWSPEDFVRRVLRGACGCVGAVCGFNYRFGNGAAGTAETLRELLGAPVTVCPAVMDGEEPVSSTRVRAALAEGRPRDAARLLGRPYAVSGEVRHGKELGRKLGFPTANLNFPPRAVIPRFGVYITDCTVDGSVYRGVTNVGVHPTVDSPETPANCETYLLGYGGDLYGKTVRVAFLNFLRPERSFPSESALREQIAADAARAAEFHPTDSGVAAARAVFPEKYS